MKKTALLLVLSGMAATPGMADDIMDCVSPLSSHSFSLKVQSEGDQILGFLQVDDHESVWPLLPSPVSSAIVYRSDLGRGSLRVKILPETKEQGWQGTLDVIDSLSEMEYHDIPLQCIFVEDKNTTK